MLESPAPRVPICGLHSGPPRYSSSRRPMRTIGDLPGRCPVRPSAYVSLGHASARIFVTWVNDAGEAGCRLRVAAATPHRWSARGIRRSRIRESTVCMKISARNAVVRGDSVGMSPLRRLERPRRPVARRQEEGNSPARPWGLIFPSHSQPGRVERRARPKAGLLPSRTEAVRRR